MTVPDLSSMMNLISDEEESLSLGKATVTESDDDSSCSSSSSSSYDDDDDDSSTGYSSDEDNSIYMSGALTRHLMKKSGSDTNLLSFLEKQQGSLKKTIQRRSAEDDSVCGDVVVAHQHSSAVFGEAGLSNPSPMDTLKDILGVDDDDDETNNIALPIISHSDQLLQQDYFNIPWDIEGYSVELTVAVRHNELDKIREFHARGNNLQCSNRFGESIVHTAARRGRTQVLQFLQDTAGVSLRVCCDSGRNPLHDACWSSEPNFECILLLLQQHAEFLFVEDRRGFTPLEYAPRSSWGDWDAFLQQHADLLVSKLKDKTYEDLFVIVATNDTDDDDDDDQPADKRAAMKKKRRDYSYRSLYFI